MLDYGLIGNCKTCALVKKDSSIDWFCFPKFDSPSVFGRILDKDKGGFFKIIPVGKYSIEQSYIKDTNILQTEFHGGRNKFVVYDFSPRYRKLLPSKMRRLFKQNRIIRIVRPIKGKPRIRVKYEPKLNYASGGDSHEIVEDNLITTNKNFTISLISNLDFKTILKSKPVELKHSLYFVIGDPDNAHDFNVKKCMRLMSSTKKYWYDWVASLITPNVNRDRIIRSALVLKLMTFSETGAIIAAPTTSLPEDPGSGRTFDYRFCWVRDASLTVDALKKIGRDHEAKKLMEFIMNSTLKSDRRMQLMYGIEGESKLTERELRHLDGFKGSKPVRIGNAAYNQKQNDIFGSIIDVIYLFFVFYRYQRSMPLKFWQFVKYLVREIENNWNKEDHSIWEFRGEKEHFVYSKLMCYVGISKAKDIALRMKKPKLAKRWGRLQDKIKEDIIANGYNERLKSFTMYYGSKDMDAANLLMSYHEFLDFKDKRLVNTILRTKKELAKGYKVKRYKIKDDFGKSRSYFTICSFWLVDALYNIRRVSEAKRMYRQLTNHSNHLGLYSEDMDERGGLHGNFPQAYTHVAMINSSILLSEWSKKRIQLRLENDRKKVK